MRIIVSGGGSAGHVSPVLATVDALQSLDKHLQVLYVGQKGGIEERLAIEAGLDFISIHGGKLRRAPDLADRVKNLRDVAGISTGAFQAWRILKRYKPDVVFNKAGPTGLPVGIAAKWLNIPMVIHEPDVLPGLANRVLSRWAEAVAVGFPPEVYDGTTLPDTKLCFTGTPVKKILLEGKATVGRRQFNLNTKTPVLLIVGGSQGAMALNTAILTILSKLSKECQVVHVTGTFDYERVQRRIKELHLAGPSYQAFPFLQYKDMAALYAASDVVVARAGANTISELAALAKPTILVPNRGAAAHQGRNASELAAKKAALAASDDNPEGILSAIESLLNSEGERSRLSSAIHKFYQPDAAQKLAQLVIKASKKGETHG